MNPVTNCVVTGGSGFIGTHLIRELLAMDGIGQIYVLDLVPPLVTDPRVVYRYCDIRHPITAQIDQPCQICLHLAALCKEPGFSWDSYFETNHRGTTNVCNFLDHVGTNSVVFTSTMMVFRAADSTMQEDSLTAPDTAYGISKLLAERELHAWKQMNNKRRLRILRPGVVFGKGENGNFTRMYYALRRGLFAFVGRRTTIKGCVYVKDVVECLKFLMTDQGSRTVYNLVLPEVTTVEYICEAFFQVFRFRRFIPTIPFPLAYVAGLLGEVLAQFGIKTSLHRRRIEKLYYSTDLSTDALSAAGFRFQYTLQEGLADWRRDCLPRDLH
jgi:GlcNAc-P-P-Und epimerase